MPAPTMSSQLENTSAILGEYMLKGWTLTDLHCDTCRVTPLMREPSALAHREGREPIQFCALCDGGPAGRPTMSAQSPMFASTSALSSASALPSSSLTMPTSLTSRPLTFAAELHATPITRPPEPRRISSGGSISRHPLSAPETESALESSGHPERLSISGRPPALDGPTLTRHTSPPSSSLTNADDHAAQISSLLLQGYSLLGDNCPNAATSCPGIPLVGYPRKKDGSRDGRRMCVSCGGRWVGERDVGGMTLIPVSNTSTSAARQPEEQGSSRTDRASGGAQADIFAQEAEKSREGLTAGGAGAESPRTKRRRELYEVGAMMNASHAAGIAGRQEVGAEQKLDEEMDMDDLEESGPAVASGQEAIQTPGRTSSSLSLSLSSTTASLTLTLDRLASSLTAHTTGVNKEHEARYFVDVKLHTEAMKDVLEVLKLVEGLSKQ